MKYRPFVCAMLALFALELIVLVFFAAAPLEVPQDPVEVNAVLHEVQAHWADLSASQDAAALDYVVIDTEGNVRFATKNGLSESVHAAVIHRDTILPVEKNGGTLGHLLIYNTGTEIAHQRQKQAVAAFVTAAFVQGGALAAYALYWRRNLLKPFRELEDFAQRVAGGNLEIPLPMDRKNIFGAFTESFDIMRTELNKARLAEARANAEKKELIAKLSHDIRTPVASIRAAAEVGAAVAESEKIRNSYENIMRKADQINTLVTNLFSATLEELQQLSVNPADTGSSALTQILQNADCAARAKIPRIPHCLLYMDALRMQQVLDNIFANAYKYAGTEMEVQVRQTKTHLEIRIEDSGGGVPEEELPALKEKFRRGRNAKEKEGAGLGLYIADRLMEAMGGALVVENGARGLAVTVLIALSGTI